MILHGDREMAVWHAGWKDGYLKAQEDAARLRKENADMLGALKWAMPLADIALEDCRQTRLQHGHDDIGRGTKVIGLWPSEVEERDKARALLAAERSTQGE